MCWHERIAEQSKKAGGGLHSATALLTTIKLTTQADYVEHPSSAEEVVSHIKHYKDKCASEGKRCVEEE